MISRVKVQPPADGAKWGSIIPATGSFQTRTQSAHCHHRNRKYLRIVKNSIRRKVGSSCLLLSGNTSARFTGLTGDMVHGRFELALQTTSSNIIIMVGAIFPLSVIYYLKHYQIQQQQNLIQLLPGFQ